jgi:hypothetical protein
MQVTATGIYTTKGGLQAVVETLLPATGHVIREDGTATKHIWQANGRHGVSDRSSQLELVAPGYIPPTPVVLEPEAAGFSAKIRNKDGTTFWTSPTPDFDAMLDLLFTQNLTHLVLEYSNLVATDRIQAIKAA